MKQKVAKKCDETRKWKREEKDEGTFPLSHFFARIASLAPLTCSIFIGPTLTRLVQLR